ncbi:MAG: hypothetical protein R2912_07005 [Eubacteriales bacterium]
MLGQLVVLRHLDAAEHVRDAGDAKQRKFFNEVCRNADFFDEILLAGRIVEQADSFWLSSSSISMTMSVFFTL